MYKFTVSIVIPSFQQATELAGCLECIHQQKFEDYEVVVVDGNSTDKTNEVVAASPIKALKFVSEPDKGIYDAMNKGVAMSSGKFLYFMGCDDRLASTAVLHEIFANKRYSSVDVLYGNVILRSSGAIYDGKFSSFKIMDSNICHQAIFVQKRVFDQIGGFNLNYRVLADWDHNMRWFGNNRIKKKYIPVTVAKYNDLGFSAHNEDDKFYNELNIIKDRNFSYITKYLYFKSKSKFINKIASLFFSKII